MRCAEGMSTGPASKGGAGGAPALPLLVLHATGRRVEARHATASERVPTILDHSPASAGARDGCVMRWRTQHGTMRPASPTAAREPSHGVKLRGPVHLRVPCAHAVTPLRERATLASGGLSEAPLERRHLFGRQVL